jgi:hypothetical protein
MIFPMKVPRDNNDIPNEIPRDNNEIPNESAQR